MKDYWQKETEKAKRDLFEVEQSLRAVDAVIAERDAQHRSQQETINEMRRLLKFSVEAIECRHPEAAIAKIRQYFADHLIDPDTLAQGESR